jgi:hypothetical protein
MSSLPVAQHCAEGPRLSSLTAGVTALQSTAFHAKCAGDPRADALIAALTDEQQREIATWQPPADAEVLLPAGGSITLRYQDAVKERAISVDANLSPVSSAERPEAISTGHPDLYWVASWGSPVEGPVVYVGDMKRSEFTTLEGPDSLQLIAYGLALAIECDAIGFVTGIWGLKEGRWWWGDFVEMGSRRSVQLAERVVAAIQNTNPGYVVGSHCRQCYGREHCPGWLIAPEYASTSLGPLTERSELRLDNASRLRLLLEVQRVEDMAEKVKRLLRAGPPISDPHTGKVYKPVQMPGREAASVPVLRKALGPDAEQFITKGKPFEQWRWSNP